VAPGNLCHRLDLRNEAVREDYFPEGKRFDALVTDLVTGGRSLEIADIDPQLWKAAAPEAGGRSFFLLAGATGNAPGRLLQYQGAIYSVGDATFAFDTIAA
jgi:aromatic ring-opening dioxygenase catalytic subunit (LigB family)